MRCWLWGVLGWNFSELAYCTGRLTQLGTLLRSIGVLRFEQSAAQIEVGLFHWHLVVLAPCLPRARPSFIVDIIVDIGTKHKPKLFCIIWSACIILLIGVEALLANTFKVHRHQLRDETSWPTSCFQNNVATVYIFKPFQCLPNRCPSCLRGQGNQVGITCWRLMCWFRQLHQRPPAPAPYSLELMSSKLYGLISSPLRWQKERLHQHECPLLRMPFFAERRVVQM